MSIDRMILGFNSFRSQYFEKNKPLYQKLIRGGQKPSIAVIACSDSRVDPAIVLQAEPGDIFSIRNVANLVPPFVSDDSHHGTSAALEFAVCGIGVEHVIVFGHAHCAGINAMIKEQKGEHVPWHFVGPWANIAAEAYVRTKKEMPDADEETEARCCEKNSVLVSLENLMTFPFIAERVNDGRLTLHGWYLDIVEGTLLSYDPEEKSFKKID
ncbi:MAG: carbonic anhydrase [Rhodospirillaceae bacterium]|nr:carbonic anhydrase [Rhodospirillaceae bacterium]